MSLDLKFDHFYLYDEIKAFLDSAVREYPALCSLASIGRSYEGRDIWCLTITNSATGPAEDKPAMYIDGNIHAGEVTGSHVCLYTVRHLLCGYGKDAEVTKLLDSRAFYLMPRVNPDGAELYLTTPTMLRSSVRAYPEEEEKEGLRAEDVNGDGMILQMRVEDESGPWKASEKDPRLLILRAPDDDEGTFYRIYPEGRIYGEPEVPLQVAPTKYGLDINRNFPANWVLGQSGAGPYPLSEPETRALAEFVLAHPNIGAFQAYHTTGGVIYRAFCSKPDDKMNPQDLQLFKVIGLRGEEITSYPCIPASHGGLGASRAGIFIDWVYEHRGIIGFTTELWDMMGRAGADKKKEMRDKTPKDIEEDQLKLLKWQDGELGGKGFVNWAHYDHPQLGKVEIGGWVPKTVRQNAPPGKLLEDECEKNCRFTIKHALTTPLLRISEACAEQVGEGVYRVTAVVRNLGYLATNLTEQAKTIKVAKPVEVKLEAAAGSLEYVVGQREQEVGHLDGRSAVSFNPWGPGAQPKQECRLEWVVKAAAGTEAVVTASCAQAGKHGVRIKL
ncbi:MAG: M14 family metallopeptidase [Bacillota bacterium]|nr:M14 family metallopeptidase [Bacillota bacterium]